MGSSPDDSAMELAALRAEVVEAMHELNNVLATIMTGVSMATRLLPTDLASSMEEVLDGCRRARTLTRGLSARARGVDLLGSPGAPPAATEVRRPSPTTSTEAQPAPVACEEGSTRVLIVDDDPSIRALGRRLVESLGYRVLVAASGAEALSLCTRVESDIRVVLLDLHMPDLPGEVTLVQLLALGRDLRVIVCSGVCDERNTNLLQQRGAVAVLTKPFTREALEAAVVAAFARKA